MQIAKKPAAKVLGMHRIFIRGKRREYVIADSALICVQVHVWSFWLDADEHHPGFAHLGQAGRSNAIAGGMADDGP